MRPRKTWRLPTSSAGAFGAEARTQLSIFRALRQARRRSTDLSSQLAQAQQEAVQQNAGHEEQIRALQAACEAAQEQAALVEDKLAAAQAIIETQTEAIAQATEQLERERRRRADQEHATRIAAEAQAQTVAALRASMVTERADWQRKLLDAQQQIQQLTSERDQAFQIGLGVGEALVTAKRKIAALEAELVEKNAFIADAGPKLKSLYARLLLIKEKQDWRL